MAYTYKHGDRPLEGYTIQRGIGRGGFGEVYYAVSDGGREVALKYLRDNAEIELRGVTHCMNLKSPHLVSIFDVKRNADGEYFIIMEHIAGPSLAELLVSEPNGLGMDKAVYLIREIGRGLAYLHDRGIVHRDLKPANIFYEDGHVKIGDYGLSKFISVSRHSAQTTSVGTVHYMAPEVGSGNYQRGIDIYALGVMLYEMLLGKVPFEGSSMGEVLMKHLTEQPEVDGLPEPFGDVIRKALEKDPKDRYQDVNEMLDDILEVGSVQQSLAGFNPKSLSDMPHRAMADTIPSPIPSPNPLPPLPPIPQPHGGGPAHGGFSHPRKLDKKLKRINDKVARKMNKLAGGRSPVGVAVIASGDAEIGHVQLPDQNTMSGVQRAFLAVIMVSGVSVGAGVATGLGAGEGEVGASTGLMIAAIILGMSAAMGIFSWLDAGSQPKWVKALLAGCCLAPPMTLACVPLAAGRFDENALALMVGMLVSLYLCNTEERLESGTRGELSFGSAFSMGLCSMICCVIAAGIMSTRNEEWFLGMGFVVGACVSLLVQALGWILPRAWTVGVVGPAGSVPPAPGLSPPPLGQGYARAPREHPPLENIPFGIPVDPSVYSQAMASVDPVSNERWMFSRVIYSFLTLGTLLGTLQIILLAVFVNDTSLDQDFFHCVGAIASGSLMIFFAQKLTRYQRPGFWRESLCPFLMAMCMTGIGTLVSALAVYTLRGGEFALAVTGLVMQSIAFCLLLASRFGAFGRKSKRSVSASPPGRFVIGGGQPEADSPASGLRDVPIAPEKPKPEAG